MCDKDPLLPKPTGGQCHESGYQSMRAKSTEVPTGNRTTQDEPQRQSGVGSCGRYKRCLVCAVVSTVTLVLLFPATIGCTVYFHNKDAACNSAIPQVDVYTRSDAYSISYFTSTLTCSEKPISVEVRLGDEDASVEIYQTRCGSIDKNNFQGNYSITANVSNGRPAPVFGEDFFRQNYFFNGSIRLDMASIITTTLTSVSVELCLFTNNNNFKAFLAAGTNWQQFIGKAECNSTQVKTGDNISTIFHIKEPIFAFVGIATGGDLSIGLDVTVTANGVEVSGPGENSTKVCQLDDKHPTCNFHLINGERDEFCLVAHEEKHSDGTYHYSNQTLTMKASTTTNVPFWVSLSFLLIIIITATILFCILIRWIYKRCTKGQYITPAPASAHNIQNPEQQPCTAPADRPTTNDIHPPNMGTGTPSVESRMPISESHQQPTPTGHSVRLICGTQTSGECTIPPSESVTEPNTQESQYKPRSGQSKFRSSVKANIR